MTHYTGCKAMTSGLRNLKGEALATDGVRSYALLIIAAGVVIAILYWARPVFVTTLIALIIAFLLEPFVGFLTRARLPRSLATFVVCAIAVMAIYFTGLSLWNQLSGIAREAPEFQNNLTAEIVSATNKLQSLGDSAGRILGGGSAGPAGTAGAAGPSGGKAPPRGPVTLPKTSKKALAMEGPVLVGVPVDYRDNHRLMEIVHPEALN